MFGLFKSYEEARSAVDGLLDEGFREAEVNAIANAEVTREAIDENLHHVRIEATNAVDGKTVRGLDAILGTQLPVGTPDAGEVFAGGDLATLTVKNALAQALGGLRPALIDLDVAEEEAEIYRRGIEAGGLLLMVRTEDERANEVRRLLHDQGGTHMRTFGA